MYRLLLIVVASLFLGAAQAQDKQCPIFDRIMNYDPLQSLPDGYTETSIPNVILNVHNEVVRTDDTVGQPPNFAILQGVTHTYFGATLCILVIDCGAANNETVTASVVNVNRNSAPVEFTLEGLCTQNGLFFGCVETSYTPVNETAPDGVIGGEFGDELQVRYTSAAQTDGMYTEFRYSVWPTCVEHQEWTFEMISDLMLKDSIDRNVKKLTNLKSKIVLLQQILFGSNDTSCEDISTVVNLAPAALDSFQFLDECIIDRNAQASDFLSKVQSVMN